MSDKYVLDGKMPRKVGSLEEWARWFETAERHVAKDEIGEARVSTVFLGIDHRWGDGPPLLFETMIFGGPHTEYQTRASTWDEAEKQHAEAVALVRTALN
jgi:hypothetical protein